MSDDPCQHWTPATLYQHFTKLREADQTALKAALDAANRRLDGMNEFRKTVDDVTRKSLTRSEALTFLAGIIGAAGTFALIWSVFR